MENKDIMEKVFYKVVVEHGVVILQPKKINVCQTWEDTPKEIERILLRNGWTEYPVKAYDDFIESQIEKKLEAEVRAKAFQELANEAQGKKIQLQAHQDLVERELIEEIREEERNGKGIS